MKAIRRHLAWLIAIVPAAVFVGMLVHRAVNPTPSANADDMDTTTTRAQEPANDVEHWPGRERSRLLAHERLPAPYEQLKPLYTYKSAPRASDWLASHKEPGRTFSGYKRSDPVRPTPERRTLYVLPLGQFSDAQMRVLRLTVEYMRLYFMTPVKLKPVRPLRDVPAKARRQRFGTTQILSTWVMHDVLMPARADDALATIAFCSNDLWPGRGWNFVYGQASLRQRVGVWSIHRNGAPAVSDEAFKTCLVRTLKTAVHEAGHMLGLLHCIAYECCMNGSNHRQESDSRPLGLCPICLAKLCWNVRCDPAERYRGLLEFCRREGLGQPAAAFQKALEKLADAPE